MKLTYDDDSCEIKFNGITIGTWNDEAHCDYPEDLTWSRTIGGLVDQVFMAGVSHGKSELESKLAKAMEENEILKNQLDKVRSSLLQIESLQTRIKNVSEALKGE